MIEILSTGYASLRKRTRRLLRRIGVMPFDEAAYAKKRQGDYARTFPELHAAVDTFVLSFPKSGRTWHRVMLGLYLARATGQPDQEALDLEKLCRAAGVPRIDYSHNGADITDYLTAAHPYFASPELWRGRKVILLVREPKAVLVSSFHHLRHRHHSRRFAGSLSDFIRDPRFGIDKIAAAHRRWHADRHLAPAFAVMSYEEMHRDPADVLRRTLTFIGLPAPDEALIAYAMTLSQFDNMQEYEANNYFGMSMMRKGQAGDCGRKVREGKTDAYRNHLSEGDIAYIDARIAELGGNPFAREIALASS